MSSEELTSGKKGDVRQRRKGRISEPFETNGSPQMSAERGQPSFLIPWQCGY
jgi:hypothetical protein